MSNRINKIIALLHKKYKNPKTELENWTTPVQLMVCVILSAQATDKGVNKITENLFKKYKSVQDFANADFKSLLSLIKSINYNNTKAKRIIDAGTYIVKNFNGNMPKNIPDLIKIPGIGRKSANVILNECFNIAHGIVVDTHVTRVANRLDLTKNPKNAEKIEQDLMNIIPKKEWSFVNNAFVLHGRYTCKAKKPDCQNCVLNKICESAFKL